MLYGCFLQLINLYFLNKLDVILILKIQMKFCIVLLLQIEQGMVKERLQM